MDTLNQSRHFIRSRLNKLFTGAKKYPLILVCAGAGYGKTGAVLDFVREYNAATIWMQLSERDNASVRFWENFTHTAAQVNLPLANALTKLGFPNTNEKMDQFKSLTNEFVKLKQRIFVIDDFHYLKDKSVIRFLEKCIIFKMPVGTSVFILSRSIPPFNTAGMIYKDMIININENELRFTEDELFQYFQFLNISLKPEDLKEIMKDTGGWVFAVNLISRSYKKAPGYKGYLRNAMKLNIFRLMESEIWEGSREPFKIFLVCLTLIEHLSVDLIGLLAGGDKNLLTELEEQNAYIRRDSFINAYLIHPLFLEFLREKQGLISEEQKKKIYGTAGNWCNMNGFKTDALMYFEKTEDYESIVSVLASLPSQIPHDIAEYASGIFEKTPKKMFFTIEHLAVMHISVFMCRGFLEKSINLAEYYEKKFLKMSNKNPLKNASLGEIYLCWGYIRVLMCVTDGCYDFDAYFEKFLIYSPSVITVKQMYNFLPGPWMIAAGSSEKGVPEKYIAALSRISKAVIKYTNGRKTGIEELALGELKFYKNDFPAAETLIINSLEQAREYKRYEIINLALFYMLRIGIAQGNYSKAQLALNEIKSGLNTGEYSKLIFNYDITLCWYYCTLDFPEKIPRWLKESFSPYSHIAFIDNLKNRMKACYYYRTRNYPPLLSYIQEMKKRESFLFERIEMLALESCINYKLKNKNEAFISLYEAYKTAVPNEITVPFIELGKDMRTLTAAALKDSGCKIPKSWLENINLKSASYAKHQFRVITEYKLSNNVPKTISLSVREKEILKDLSHGLSRAAIASGRSLSINTVKMIINNIYVKLGAGNLPDAIRIAVGKKII